MFWRNYYPVGLGCHIEQAKADFWRDEILLDFISSSLHLGNPELGFTKILTELKILTGEVGLDFEVSLQLSLFLRGWLYVILFCLSVMEDADTRLLPGPSQRRQDRDVLLHPSEHYTWTARPTGSCKSVQQVLEREQAPLSYSHEH